MLSQDGEEIEYLKGQKSYTEVLSKAGYTGGLSGKWHLGHSSLVQMGFSYWNVHASGAGNYYKAPMIVDGVLDKSDRYVTDVITDNALKFLEDQIGSLNPFFLNVHYTAPHAPWDRANHPTELFDEYFLNCSFNSLPAEEVHPNQLNKEPHSGIVGDTETTRRSNLSGYFTAVTEMDRNIGRLLDWLALRNLLENTLVIFTSDNGMNMGHHGIWGKGNGTYPPNMFDTAIKVPTLISRPTHVPEDLVCEKLLSQYDFVPTLLGYLRMEFPADKPLPGKDFSSILRGKSLGVSTPVFVLDEYGSTRMIRTETWKYVHRYPAGPHELYNLVSDPSESSNLIDGGEHQERIEYLRLELENWFSEYVDPRIDGTQNNATGRGQVGLLGSPDYNKPFADDLVFFSDNNKI